MDHAFSNRDALTVEHILVPVHDDVQLFVMHMSRTRIRQLPVDGPVLGANRVHNRAVVKTQRVTLHLLAEFPVEPLPRTVNRISV